MFASENKQKKKKNGVSLSAIVGSVFNWNGEFLMELFVSLAKQKIFLIFHIQSGRTVIMVLLNVLNSSLVTSWKMRTHATVVVPVISSEMTGMLQKKGK